MLFPNRVKLENYIFSNMEERQIYFDKVFSLYFKNVSNGMKVFAKTGWYKLIHHTVLYDLVKQYSNIVVLDSAL